MNTLGKISLALTLLLTGLLLAVATNTYGSKGATLVLIKERPAGNVVYRIPAAPNDREESDRARSATIKTESSFAQKQRLLAPLHLSRHALQTASIFFFGLGVVSIAGIYRKRRVE